MEIKEKFGDALSQKNYDLLQEYRKTKNYQAIVSMSALAYEEKNKISFLKHVASFPKEKKVLWGQGAIAQELLLFFQGNSLEFDYCYANNWVENHDFMGIPFLSLEEMKENIQHYCFFIGTSIPTYIQEIKEQLASLGALPRQIVFTCGDLGRQYFDLPEIQWTEKEIFVDAGCFNGDDVLAFAEATQGRYEKIYAFEPDKDNYQKCCNRLQGVSALQMEMSGLWQENTALSFSQLATGSSHVVAEAGDLVSLRSLDDVLKGKPITYLKMDIEGAELSALQGACQTIQKHRPKLAICVYHKENDIQEIPDYLSSLVPEYRFYLRHYSLGQLESVLYAI